MLLWLILLSCVIKVFIQVELGRYAITHGKTTLAAIDTLPGPRLGTTWLAWLWLFMMLATQAQIAAMEGLIGQAAHSAFPGGSAAMARAMARLDPGGATSSASHPEYAWASLTGLAAVALLLSGGYKRLEHVTTALVAGVTLITVACVAGLPLDRLPGGPGRRGRRPQARPSATAGAAALAFSAFGITGVGASELSPTPTGASRRVTPARSGSARPTTRGRCAPGAGCVSCRSTPGSA